MVAIAPDTRVRLAVDELDGISLAGAPSSASVEYASTGESAEWDTSLGFSDGPALRSLPDLVTVTWDMSGAQVSAQLDIVASRYCTVADIKSWRADQYALAGETDEAVFAARARAEEVIERACGRTLQPVLRTGVVDRPNCTVTSVPLMDGAEPFDLRKVVRAVGEDGQTLDVKAAPSQTALDVRVVPQRQTAIVSVLTGLPMIPAEAHDAVCALAAWYLVPSVNPENASATSMSTDAGVVNFIVGCGGGAATSLPEVNALIQRYRLRKYMVR